MNQIRILTVLCAGMLLWMAACTTEYDKSNLLSGAIRVVDDNPQEALELLEGISPDYLYDCEKVQYMKFVVTLTQARYMDYQDITGDSLILDAQRYFARTRNYEMAARAGYYAASYWYERDSGAKAAEYWLAAFYHAGKAGNDLFLAKSAYSLGMSYFNQEQWEDAMPYCRKALEFYNQESNAGNHQLSLMNMLGYIHQKLGDPEQAFRYFDNGLKAAIKQNDSKYESRFLRGKGTIHHDKGEYRQAKEYFDLALSKQPEPGDLTRVYLSYAKLYRMMNLPDSTLYYLNTIEDRIREITYPNILRGIYSELAKYYGTNQRNEDKVAHYSLLAHNEELRIKKNLSEEKVDAINQQLEQLRQKKRIESKTYRRIFDYGLIALCMLAFLLVIIWLNRHELKERYQQIRRKYNDICNLQFTQTVDQLHFLLAGLRSVAKSTDELCRKELAYAGSPVWDQQQVLLKEFSTQLAGYAKLKLKKLQNGRTVLPKLTTEDLSIMQLSRFRIPDENIGWMLGYKGDTKEPIILRKERIRRILAEAGMSEKDIKTFFVIENS